MKIVVVLRNHREHQYEELEFGSHEELNKFLNEKDNYVKYSLISKEVVANG